MAAMTTLAGADTAMLAETRAFNAELEARLDAEPAVHEVPVEQTRRKRREGLGPFPAPVFLDRARDMAIEGRSGRIGLRIVAPEQQAVGAYLHIHGGGWALSAADMQDPILAELADATGLCAVSVDYRLAPEHPYPAALDDCEDAALWLLREGFGELRLPDRHAITGSFAAANLIYGVFDLSMTPSQRLWGERNLILSTPILHYFGDMFLPGLSDEARRDPDISPLYAELHDMPPALFTVGTMDPLLDDSLFMHARWAASGARAELRTWPEAIHGFNAFPLRVTAAARAEQYAFLRAAVDAS